MFNPKAAVIYSKSGTNFKREKKMVQKSFWILVHYRRDEYKFVIYIYTPQRNCQYSKYPDCYISNGFLDVLKGAT